MSSPATPGTRDDRTGRWRALAWAGGGAGALLVAGGLATLAGPWLRASALVPEDSPLPASAIAYTDAPDAGRFFDARDSVTVTVPWTMTVAEFLSLYHLENSAGARAALRDQLGADDDADRLERGAAVLLNLTERAVR